MAQTKPTRRHFATVGRRQVHYRRAGDGPPILLLHPSPESSRCFEALIERLALRFTVFAPDTPGNGQSTPLDLPDPEMADFAGALSGLLDELGIARIAVYGYHTGALCALEFARRYPDRVALAIINGYLQMDADFRRDIAANFFPPLSIDWSGSHLTWLWARMREQWHFFPWYRRTLASRAPFDPPDSHGIHASVIDMLESHNGYRGPYRAAFTYDAAEAVVELTVPTLVTCARDDILFPGLALMPATPDVVEVRPADTLAACEALLEDALAALPERLPVPAAASAARPVTGDLTRDFVQLDQGSAHLMRNDDGVGRPIVIQHALSESTRCVERLLRAFAGRRPVIAVDLPGHGQSEFGEEGRVSDIDFHAQVLGDALSAAGVNDADFVTWGTGALPVLALARRFPERVGHLAALRLSWPERLPQPATITEPEIDEHGGHLLRTWHRLRDQELYEPWTDRRVATIIRCREPDLDPQVLQARLIARVAGRNHEPALLAAVVAFDMSGALRAVKSPLWIADSHPEVIRQLQEHYAGSITVGAPTAGDFAALARELQTFFEI